VDTEYEPPFVHNGQGERSAAIIQIDSGRHVAANVICAAICGMSLVIAIVSGIVTWNLNTETRVTQSKYEAVKNRLSEIEGELRALPK
jgi:hypothetical protein